MSELKNEPRIDPDEVLDGILEWVTIESPTSDAGGTLVELFLPGWTDGTVRASDRPERLSESTATA